MHNVWLPGFRCTSKPGLRSSISLFNAFSTAPSREPQSLRPLWSSIVPAPWRPQPSSLTRHDNTNPPRNHAHTSTITPAPIHHPPQRMLHTSPSLHKRTKGRPPPSSRVHPSQSVHTRIRIPFSAKSPAQLAEIFNRPVDPVDYNSGNEILCLLHARRVTGSLVEEGVAMVDNDSSVIKEPHLLSALEWLRKHYPLDEQAAAERWAEMESDKVSQGYIDRAESLGLFKKGTGADFASRSSEQLGGADDGAYSTTATGRSALDEMKAYNERKAKEEKVERIKSGEEQKVTELRLAKQEKREQGIMERDERIAKKREERAKRGMITQIEEVPDMTATQRLLYPTIFSVLLVFGMYTWAQTYKPPVWETRLYREVPNSVATIGAIIAINLCVWSFWRMPPLWRLLNKYMIVVPAIPVTPSILGNVFSHPTLWHLTSNMAGLWLWGIPVHEELGRGTFLAIYISGGTLGALASLSSHVLAGRFHTTSTGASGAVYAIGVVWAWFYWDDPVLPDDKNFWPFIVDVARWSVVVTSAIFHFLPAFWIVSDGVAHIGGMATGLVGAAVVRSQRKEEKRVREVEERLRNSTVGEVER